MTSTIRLNKRRKWLRLLRHAINNNVKIGVNHRFKYKGKNLGTFLVDAKRHGKPELIAEIKKIGLDFANHDKKDPENYIRRYTEELRNNPNPKKDRYITRFNHYVLPKKDLVSQELKENLEVVWKEKFGDVRKWSKKTKIKDRVDEWKAFRYNKEVNPDGNWFAPYSKMGSVYFWVYKRRNNKKLMKLILHKFTEKELLELIYEGF